MDRRALTILGILLGMFSPACGADSSPNGPPAGGSGGSGSGGGSSLNTGGAASGATNGTGGTSSVVSGGSGAGATGGQLASSGGESAAGGSATGGGLATGGALATGGDLATGGGAATGGGPALPEFVTSGPDDYWNTGNQVTKVTAAADLTVDETQTFQVWHGFGGTFNEMGWDALAVVSSEITRALTLLFDAEEGAHFAFGRIPLGASDYSMSWYTLAETANDYALDHFSIARDEEMLIPFIKAAQEIKPDLRFFASPWVIPSWMMDGSRNMKSDAQTLSAHAHYMAKFVQEYEKVGISIEAIHPQNEPGYARVHWTQPLFIDFIKSYLGPIFAELNLDAEIWCGTMSHPNDGIIATTLADDEEAMQYVSGFGLQWNLQDTVATLAAKRPVMQTEHKCGNYNFETPYWDQSRYDPSKAQNDHLYGEESWQLIRDWITAGVNSYVAWNMVLDTVGKSLDGWPQNALLTVDRSRKELIVTPAYYVFKHYSHYILPGATRLGISGSDDALAFKNPDGSIVTEVYNAGDVPKTMTLAAGGATYQFEVPAHGWATVRTTP